MAGHPKTLDLKEPQILRHYPADLGGYFWHHRLLLEKCSPGVWIGATPDLELERIDLASTTHITLDRRADFPAPQSPFVYAFDELSRAELETLKRRAKTMNNLWNDATVADVEELEWIIADPSRADFGELVGDDAVDDGVVLENSAIIEKTGEEVFARRISASAKAAWILEKEKTKGDLRLLGDFRDAQDRRFLEFGRGIDLMRNSDISDWPLVGPRATKQFLQSVRSGSSDLVNYHLNWKVHSGISSYSAGVHEHRVICDALKNFLSIDQVDLSNLVGVEILTRRLIQIETATSRNPSNPDYSGLDVIMEQPLGPSGEAQVLRFSEWVGSRLKERAQVQKHARLYREEFSRKKVSSDDQDGDGRGRGRGRGRGDKTKPKAAASSSAAGSA